jgi:hypothetical protein
MNGTDQQKSSPFTSSIAQTNASVSQLETPSFAPRRLWQRTSDNQYLEVSAMSTTGANVTPSPEARDKASSPPGVRMTPKVAIASFPGESFTSEVVRAAAAIDFKHMVLATLLLFYHISWTVACLTSFRDQIETERCTGKKNSRYRTHRPWSVFYGPFGWNMGNHRVGLVLDIRFGGIIFPRSNLKLKSNIFNFTRVLVGRTYKCHSSSLTKGLWL